MTGYNLGLALTLAFLLGIQVADWSARENHATAYALGQWTRALITGDTP